MKQVLEQALFMIGCNHKHAPLDIRESFALSSNNINQIYETLLNEPGIEEVLILNTCNRVEIYIVADTSNRAQAVIEHYCRVQEVSKEAYDPYFSFIEGRKVVEHLFKVASGLDSQLVGEAEILGQLKEAYAQANERKSTGRVLNKVLQKSFQAAKWSRTNTAIGKGQVSIGSVTADLAIRIFGALSSTRILVIGSGEVGENAVHALKIRGANDLTVTNRTFERAYELSQKISGTAIHYELFPKMINLFDIVICSTGAPEVVLCSDTAQKAMAQRPEMPLFLIDLSMPRNICHTTAEIPNTFLYNLDDLSRMANENMKARQAEVETCKSILEKKADYIWQHFGAPQPGTVIGDDLGPTVWEVEKS